MPSPSASTFFRFVRDPKHDGGGEKPQIARIEADLGVGYRRQDCQGGKTTKGTKEGTERHEARRGTQSQRTQRTQRGRGRGPRRTGWTARGNRRLRGLGQIGGRLPPTGLPGGKITKRTKGGTEGHEARRGGKGQSQRAQRTQRGARAWPAQDDGGKPQIARIEADWGSATADRTARGGQRDAGGEGGRERSAGEARRATGGARKPPAQPGVFAVEPRRISPRVKVDRRLSRGGSAADPGGGGGIRDDGGLRFAYCSHLHGGYWARSRDRVSGCAWAQKKPPTVRSGAFLCGLASLTWR